MKKAFKIDSGITEIFFLVVYFMWGLGVRVMVRYVFLYTCIVYVFVLYFVLSAVCV